MSDPSFIFAVAAAFQSPDGVAQAQGVHVAPTPAAAAAMLMIQAGEQNPELRTMQLVSVICTKVDTTWLHAALEAVGAKPVGEIVYTAPHLRN